jgi:hypothetical protein
MRQYPEKHIHFGKRESHEENPSHTTGISLYNYHRDDPVPSFLLP